MPLLLLSWCFGVTKWSYNQKPAEAPRSQTTWNLAVLCARGPPCMATLETCQLVVTWQHCWHENDVEEFKLCMDYGQSVCGYLSIALLQKK